MNLQSVLWIVLVCSFAVPASGEERPLLAPIFQDHAVLQRDRPVRIFGSAPAAEVVTVTLADHTVRATADASGAWNATLPAMAAGGPYTLTATSGKGGSQSISDVMVGDVWLCSGQSNMEWPVSASLYATGEIARSANDRIRLLTVPHGHGPAARDRFESPTPWKVAGPDTVGAFSATCYFFARELQKTVPVPMGLINASWGGSRIEPWISSRGLAAMGGFDDALELLRVYAKDPAAATARLGALWETWWRSRPAAQGSEPWQPASTTGWREAPAALGDWKRWGVPELANFNGMVWYRREIDLTNAQANGAAMLALGQIDEVDQTWVNGTPVGNTFGWGTERTYELSPGVLRLADGTAVPLGGAWQYQKAPDDIGSPLRAPWESIGGTTTLYNAMIAPIGPIALRGALWYQGESNTSEPDRYERLLAGLMADWRDRFGADLPFLIVQLPNFGELVAAPVESGWASLRDAQRRAVDRDPHAALAVTIDVGDARDLHPPNKQAVGVRLARAARNVVYDEAIAPSGPRPERVERLDDGIAIAFRDVEGALVAYSASGPIAFEVCGTEPASCRFAAAAIDGARVIVSVPEGAAAERVRYCWGDAPMCNLYDKSGLPAGPFEVAVPSPQTRSQ